MSTVLSGPPPNQGPYPNDFHRWAALIRLIGAQQEAVGAAAVVKGQAAHCRAIGCSETRIAEAIDAGSPPSRVEQTLENRRHE